MTTPGSVSGPSGGLALIWLLYGVLRAAGAAFLVVFSATFTLMAGAVLTRVPNPLVWMAWFHFVFWVVIAWCVVCAILSFFAAGALFSRASSNSSIVTLAALVCLPEIPFGVILGVYTLLIFGPRRSASSL